MDRVKFSFRALSLCLAVLCAVSFLRAPMRAKAAYYTPYELAELEKSMEDKCTEILYTVYHDEYWDGGCAEWTNDQLKLNNIGYVYRGYNSYGYDDGFDWFAGLDDGAVTDYGYKQVKYPGPDCLYDLIYEYGGYPIFNVVLSWELGNEDFVAAGHVIYVWCIYDGYIYYADTFDQFLHKAGHIIKQPVDEFLEIYTATNGPMLGAVHFEGAEEVHYTVSEVLYATYEVKEDCDINTIPAYTLDGEDTVGGSVAAGDTFNVRGAYNGDDGSRWYKIEGGMWINSEKVKKTANISTMAANGISVPDVWCYHQGFDLVGTIVSYASPISSATAKITDLEGNILAGGDFNPDGTTFSVGTIDEDTYFEHFTPGKYRYIVSASNDYETRVFVDSEFEIRNMTYADSTSHSVTLERRALSPADCNIDGTVDSKDLDCVKDYCLYEKGGKGCFIDVNGDGKVNLTDYAEVALSLE